MVEINTSSDRVLVIGAAGMDVVGRLDGDLHAGTSNPARIRTSYGGVARNVAENLARLGQPVSLITVVGEDMTGDDILAYTEQAGVDISAVLRTAEYPTGFYMGVLDPRGRLEFAVDDMRSISRLTPEHLREQEALFKSSALLFVDSNLPEKTLRTAFSLARRAKLPVCADPTSTGLAEKLKKYIPRITLVTPNTREAGVLVDRELHASDRESALEAARSLVSQGTEIAMITMAEFGVCYATVDTNGHIPAIRTRITDPTGAGDALTSAVIFGLLNDIPLDEAIRLGVSAASLTLRYKGTVDPDLSLEKLYDQLLI